jgi:hypothetical protein
MNGLGLRTGELFPGAADRFDREIEPPGLVEPLANVPDDIASLVEVAGENSLCRMTAETCRRAPGQGPGPARSQRERLSRGTADRVRVFDALLGILLIVGRRQVSCDACPGNVGAVEISLRFLHIRAPFVAEGIRAPAPPFDCFYPAILSRRRTELGSRPGQNAGHRSGHRRAPVPS